MPRVARIVVPGCPHHITQRGNNRQDVFFVDDDRVRYLEILAAQAERFGLTVEGYCLMTNHVHLIATPHGPDSLAKAVGRTNLYYTRYINGLHGRSGHLWQDRFFSCPLDDAYFWTAMIYVERNPVAAGLVTTASAWRWSSAATRRLADPIIELTTPLAGLPAGWVRMVNRPQSTKELEALQRCISRGAPFGREPWVKQFAKDFGLESTLRPRGRPRKP